METNLTTEEKMKEFKGNKSPWAMAEDWDNCDRIVIYSDEGIQPHICYTPDFAIEDPVHIANAQLIAAAPDLLESLQLAISTPPSEWNGEHREKCLSAINKALGD